MAFEVWSWIWPLYIAGAFACAAIAGRVALSFLPPGRVGSHRGRDAATTLATSLVLGLPCWAWPISLIERQLDHYSPVGFAEALLATATVTAAWLVVGLARWRLGPHAIVPQREIVLPRPMWTTLPILAACTVPLWRVSVVSWWSALSLVLVSEFALRGFDLARRPPVATTLVVLAIVAGLQLDPWAGLAAPAVPVAAGAAFSIEWLRRADRRALWLAAIAFALSSAWSNVLWIAGLASLIGATHRNARGAAWRACGFATLVVVLKQLTSMNDVRMFRASGEHGASPVAALASLGPWAAIWIACGVGVVAALAGLNGGAMRVRSGDPPTRETRAVAVFVAAALALYAIESAIPGREMLALRTDWSALLATLLPAGALVFGLAFLPVARSGHAT